MSKSLRAAALSSGVLAMILLLAAPVWAKAPAGGSPSFPFGKYQGSAVGGDGEPFAITVYVTGSNLEDVSLTVVTDKLPIPLSVTPEYVREDGEGQWVTAVSVNNPSLKLSGSGTGHVVFEDGKAAIYGDGSGSFRSKSGSGHGFAQAVAGDTGTGAQVIDALNGFVGGPPDEVAATAYPPRFEERGEASEPGPMESVTSGVRGLFGQPMDASSQLLLFILVLLLFLLFGLL